ncbi:hypothetical protein lerEdw1_007262 [Lerista edwardsae]|nr:hypothetical protein lerEdw1_007262 [Lerista edwardsae]
MPVSPSTSLMALKAEVPLLDYLKVSLKCKREEGKGKTVTEPLRPVRSLLEQDGARPGPAERVPNAVDGVGWEEPQGSWREEYLIAKGAGHGRPVCMVCGDVLSASGPVAAREHILRQHSHSLDFTLEEKRNILEAWGEEGEAAGLSSSPAAVAVLPGQEASGRGCGGRERRPLGAGSGQSFAASSPGRSRRPAEIEVLLDPEEQPAGRKRGPLKARCGDRCSADPARTESRVRSQSQQRRLGSGSSKDTKLKQAGKSTGEAKSGPRRGGVPGSAPAEIRIFTDGSFPAGFALKLYCRTQPEPSEDSSPEPDTKKERLGKACGRLPSTATAPCPCCGFTPWTPLAATARAGRPPPGPVGGVRDCGAPAGQGAAPLSRKDPSGLGSSFNPSWRARFLMDYDAAAGRLLCMVCEAPLRRVCLATVKRHILQCHAETLHLPREVRRAIREVWETRAQSPSLAGRK